MQKYTETEIGEALPLYSGQYFPSVDDITTLIERRRKRAGELRQELYWVEYERNNRDIGKFMREHDGKTPQQVWCEENREEVERLNALLPGKEIHVKGGEEIGLRSNTGTDANAHTKTTPRRDDMEEHPHISALPPNDGVSVQSDGQSSKEAQ